MVHMKVRQQDMNPLAGADPVGIHLQNSGPCIQNDPLLSMDNFDTRRLSPVFKCVFL